MIRLLYIDPCRTKAGVCNDHSVSDDGGGNGHDAEDEWRLC